MIRMKTVIDKYRTVHLANTKPGRESGYVAIEKQIWFCFDPFFDNDITEIFVFPLCSGW